MGEIESVVLLTEPQFMFGFATQRCQSYTGFLARRVQTQRLLELEACFRTFSCRAQRSTVGLT